MQRLINPIVLLLLCICGSACAQQAPLDLVDQVIIGQFRDHSAELLCLNENLSLPIIKTAVIARLPQAQASNAEAIAKVVYTLYPCPFSPYRKELRPAATQDIEGVWLFPETSQKLRFGPKPSDLTSRRFQPVKCEAVAFYPNGEIRNAQIVGASPCLFASAKDMDISRNNPRVASWTVQADGRLAISRTDVQNHVEEWEVFSVVTPFDVHGIHFDTGDLVQYLRRERGNDFNAATMFRHLQRLR